MTFTVIQPADVETAIDCLRRAPLLVDSPTQRRQRNPDGLSRAFAGADFRRPDLVWAAVENGGKPRAVVEHATAGGGLALCLYDVATLHYRGRQGGRPQEGR